MRKSMRFILFTVVLMVSMVVFGACGQAPSTPTPKASPTPSPSPTAQVYKWKMVTFLPAANMDVPPMREFTQNVKKATRGQIDIQLFTGDELMPTLETWEGLSKGVVQVFHSYGAYWVGKTMVAAVSTGLPYTTENSSDYNACINILGIDKIFQSEYAKSNIYYLQPTVMAEEVTLWTRRPINTVADLKGLKIRATGFTADAMTEAGASCVMLTMGEIYGALESGTIDGKITGSTGGDYPLKYHKVAKYQLNPGVMRPNNCEMLVNMDTWKALPDDLKETFSACVAKWTQFQIGYGQKRDVEMQAKVIKEEGVTPTYMDAENVQKMRDAAWRVYDRKAQENEGFGKAWAIIKGYLQMKFQK